MQVRRLALGVWIPLLSLGCFNGEDARGLPCEKDSQCGTNLACVLPEATGGIGICGGDGGGTASTGATDSADSSDASDSTAGPGPCAAATVPTTCTAAAPLTNRTFDTWTYDDPPQTWGNIAVTTGYFLGQDRLPDLAIGNLFVQDVVLFRNTGAAAFQRSNVGYPLALGPYDIKGADFDCDGETDIAAASLESTDFRVAYGTGDGLSEFTTKGVVADVWSLGVGDLVGDDGRPEVVAAGSSNVFVWTSTEREWDVTTQSFDGEFVVPWSTILGDVDGDGLVDIVLPDTAQDDFMLDPPLPDGRMFLVRNGVPLRPEFWSSPDLANPIDAAMTDLDGDGDLDLAIVSKHIDLPLTTSSQPGSLSFHLNDGAGSFTPLGTPQALGVGANAIVTADFDCDGNEDLAVGHDGMGDGIWILWGPDHDVAAATQMAAGAQAGALTVGDLDGDGYPDLAAADFGFGDADGTVVLAPSGVVVLFPREGT
jgi:hypothetical protein